MAWPTIHKATWPGGVVPNVVDYETERAGFSWEKARHALDGLPGGRGLNIAHEAADRHVAGPGGDRTALLFLPREGRSKALTYSELAAASNRFANLLEALGVGEGERVFSLLGRVPELYISLLGTLKRKSVFSPLFSAFGPEPIRERLERGDGRVLVTTEALYQRKVAPVRDRLPGLSHVLLVGPEFDASLAGRSDRFEIPPTDEETMALLHFTSGTTGSPKGAVHVHGAAIGHYETGRSALDLHPEDVFWCTADPGWVTGTSYGVIAPLMHGVTSVVDEAEFEAERWYSILQDHHVSVWYTAPTALRMLMKAGPELARRFDLSALRFVASVGEPLNPEAVVFGEEAFGLPVHDNWWQTETGGIMIANLASTEIRPGSMGRPLPGIEAAILRRGPDGRAAVKEGQVEVIGEADTDGELALRAGWPSMFRGYLHETERYAKCFASGWYLTGDLARRDRDGWFWFVGRADDVIKSAGHLIGPFEVESVLMEHPAVVEAGVIGLPDPVAGEVVKGFVSLREGYEPSEELALELLGFARRRLGAAIAPRQIGFDQHLPKTKSGKIMRRLLKARELGLEEGDTSTLEVAR